MKGRDPNDILREDGADAVRAALDGAKPFRLGEITPNKNKANNDKVVTLNRQPGLKPPKPIDDGLDWLQQCVFGETGRPLAVLASALAVLRAVMPDAFAYDEMLYTPLLMHSLEDEPNTMCSCRECRNSLLPELQLNRPRCGRALRQ
jgi:hypothetical protein